MTNKDMILEKVKDYFINVDGINYYIEMWTNTNNPLEIYFSLKKPNRLTDIIDSGFKGNSISEVVINIKENNKRIEEEKRKVAENKIKAGELMRKFISDGLKIGTQGDLLLEVTSFDLCSLEVSTKIKSNLGWEHVFKEYNKKVKWRFTNDNIWIALDFSSNTKSIMYIEDSGIRLWKSS